MRGASGLILRLEVGGAGELADDPQPRALPSQDHDHVEDARNVGAKVCEGEVVHALAREEFDAEERVLGRACVDGRGRSVVPCVERLERLEGFLGQTDLAHHEPVGTHPKGVRHEIPNV